MQERCWPRFRDRWGSSFATVTYAQHLTRQKIRCCERFVHATQHTGTMAKTSSANPRLARGQGHCLDAERSNRQQAREAAGSCRSAPESPLLRVWTSRDGASVRAGRRHLRDYLATAPDAAVAKNVLSLEHLRVKWPAFCGSSTRATGRLTRVAALSFR